MGVPKKSIMKVQTGNEKDVRASCTNIIAFSNNKGMRTKMFISAWSPLIWTSRSSMKRIMSPDEDGRVWWGEPSIHLAVKKVTEKPWYRVSRFASSSSGMWWPDPNPGNIATWGFWLWSCDSMNVSIFQEANANIWRVGSVTMKQTIYSYKTNVWAHLRRNE